VRRSRDPELPPLKPGPFASAAAVFGLGLYGVYGPYLEQHATAQLSEAFHHTFATWRSFTPGDTQTILHHGFPGFLLLALALAGLILGRRREPVGTGFDPRWALLAGVVLVAMLCVSPSNYRAAPPLYAWLTEHVPGFDTVRRPYKMVSGIHIALSILGGLGAAAVMRRVPDRARSGVVAGMIALALLCTVRPDFFGLGGPVVFAPYPARPDDSAIEFFEKLEALGNEGPVAEAPLTTFIQRGYRILLHGYHGRPTSTCINHLAPTIVEVDSAIRALPSREAVESLRAMGFTTVVVHDRPNTKPIESWRFRLRGAARRGQAPLREIHADRTRTAFEILEAPED
jgi:hypothetical protein